MDSDWASNVLDRWIADASRARVPAAYSDDPSPWANRFGHLTTQLQEREDQTARVIQKVLELPAPPSLLVVAGHDEMEVQAGIDLAIRAYGRLRTRAETQLRLGSMAPSMSADALHPLIWEAASKHWEVGHYGAAVQRAATMLNADIQDRVGRPDVSETTLMQQVFSLDPPQVGKPRLRWPGAENDLTVKSMRVGISHLSQGVFSAIRNPATHSTDDMGRQEALEQLATLSMLSRWIERCVLVVA